MLEDNPWGNLLQRSAFTVAFRPGKVDTGDSIYHLDAIPPGRGTISKYFTALRVRQMRRGVLRSGDLILGELRHTTASTDGLEGDFLSTLLKATPWVNRWKGSLASRIIRGSACSINPYSHDLIMRTDLRLLLGLTKSSFSLGQKSLDTLTGG